MRWQPDSYARQTARTPHPDPLPQGERGSELDREKLFYERFWALHGDPQLVEVFKRFGPSVFRRSSVLEGFAAFLEAQGFGGGRCVEIGTLTGLTAIVLARRFEQVVSIDIEANPLRQQIADHLGVRNVRFVTVPNNRAKAQAIDALHFDAAYVDGDHARDTEQDFALVERCGRVLLHEHWPPQPSVVELVNRLRSQGTVSTAGKLALWTR